MPRDQNSEDIETLRHFIGIWAKQDKAEFARKSEAGTPHKQYERPKYSKERFLP